MKKFKIIPVTLLFTMVTATAPVWAENGTNDQSLDTVYVTATKVHSNDNVAETNAQEPPYSHLAVPESSKATTETFTRADIDKIHPKDIFDLIQHAAGVMGYNNGSKEMTAFKSRGGNVGVILDGSYLTYDMYTRMLARIPVDMVGSMTVVRGASSLTVGPMANIGGWEGIANSTDQTYIIIKTRKATSTGNEVIASYGSLNTNKETLIHDEKINDNSYYNFAFSGNWKNGINNNYENSKSVFFKYGETDKNNMSVDATYFYNHDNWNPELSYTTSGMQPGNSSRWTYDPIISNFFAVNITKPWSDHSVTTFNVGYSGVQSTYLAHSTAGRLILPIYNEKETLTQMNLQQTITSGSNTFKFGIQAMRWLSPSGMVYTTTWTNFDQHLYGIYLYDEKKINDKLTLDGGARLDKQSGSYDGPAWSCFGYKNSWNTNTKSLSIGANYKMDSVYTLSARMGYVNEPTDTFVTSTNNTILQDEKKLMYDLGITAKYNKHFNVSFTPYIYNIQNCKVPTNLSTRPSNGGVANVVAYSAMNLTRSGFESAIYGQFTDQWGYKISETHFTSNNAADSVTNPHNISSFMLSYKQGSINGNISLLHYSKFLLAPNNPYPMGGYSVISANISKELNSTTKITLYGNNLSNAKYATGLWTMGQYFWAPGRTYGVELSKKF